MKQYQSLFAAALLLAAGTAVTSCSNEDTATAETSAQEATQRAHVRLLCNVPTVAPPRQAQAVTRATMTANGKSITDLYILDYDKVTGALLQVLHQTSEAADFAEPDITLDYGEHILRMIATRSDAPQLTTADGTAWSITANAMTAITGEAPTLLTADKTSDTFAAEVDVTVKTGEAQSVSVTLERNVARIILNSTDDFPTDCAAINLTMDEYKAIRLADLYVIDPLKNHCFFVRTFLTSALAAVTLCGCEKPIIEVDDTPTEEGGEDVRPEVLIAENDTAWFYLSGVEYSDITLTAYPTPQTLIADSRFRLPTKLEISGTLKTVTILSGYWQSKQRILCQDLATGIYYTYIPGGSVTRAGYKTEYCILPIRTESKTNGGSRVTITINDKWND